MNVYYLWQDEKFVGLQMRHGVDEKNSSSITLGSSSNGSVILLKDNKGTRELTTTNTGEYENLHVKKALLVGSKTKNNVSISGREVPGLEIARSGINSTSSIFLTASPKGVGILLEDSNGEHLITSKNKMKTLWLEKMLIVGNPQEEFVVISTADLQPYMALIKGSFQDNVFGETNHPTTARL